MSRCIHDSHCELDKAFNAKKYEILGDLERAKEGILRDLAGIDKVSLAKLRMILADYDKLTVDVSTKINNLEKKMTLLVDKYVVDPEETNQLIEQLKKTQQEVNASLEQVKKDVEDALDSVEDLANGGNYNLKGKNIAIIGDSSAARFQNSGFLETYASNVTLQKLAKGGAYFKGGDNSIFNQVHKITGNPDYIVIWGGGNDLSLWKEKKIGVPTYSSFDESEFDETTTFGGLNKLLCYLRNEYPSSKLIGLIRTCRRDINREKYNFVYHVINNLYRKWGVPVVNMEYYANISPAIAPILDAYYAEDKGHYGTLACKVTADLLVGVIQNGGIPHEEIPCNVYFYDGVFSDPKVIVKAAQELLYIEKDCSYSFDNCCFKALDDSTYCICNVFARQGNVNILRFSSTKNMITHFRKTPDSEDVLQAVMIRKMVIKAGDVMTLEDGDYVVLYPDVDNVENLPDGVTSSTGDLLIQVRETNASRRTILLTINNGDMYVGKRTATSVKWIKK